MPDVLLFGATGFTGRLTARALARRGLNTVLAGRNRAALEELAAETGAEVRMAQVGDKEGLVEALDGVRVLVTCVGPFAELGHTAVEAALAAGVHYIDSTGEGDFIARLFREHDDAARSAGIAMAPALGFDEVPADVAATIATEGMTDASLVVTYATNTLPSGGTARTLPRILAGGASFLRENRREQVGFAARERWAPFPAPLGPRPSFSGPFSIAHLAPAHLPLRDLETYFAATTLQRPLLRAFAPVIRAGLGMGPIRAAAASLGGRLGGPEGAGRDAPWTILAEARDRSVFRNVVLVGKDVYGLTAETLALGAAVMADAAFDRVGVLAPVEALGLEPARKELDEQGVSFSTYEAV